MEITEFVYPFCPYCKQAGEVLEELYQEHPEFQKIVIKKINEVANPKLAGQYDYEYCPSFFKGQDKLYEAEAADSRQEVKEKLERMLKSLL